MIMAKKEGHSIVLIDYGYASYYRDNNGIHFSEDKDDKFQGNILFASLNRLNFIKPSRRDDLYSLCKMMIYLLNDL